MKTYKVLLSVLSVTGLVALVFFGCQKETKKSPANGLTASALKGPGGGGGGPVTAPYTVISFNPNPGVVGQDFTASVSLNPVADCGYVELDQAQYTVAAIDGSYNIGDPAPSAAVTAGIAAWADVANVTLPGTLPISYTYVPSVAGLVGYRAHYEPRGGQCGYTGRPSIVVDAVIGAGCTEGLSPELTGAVPLSTDATGTTWQFTVTFHLNTCGNGYVGKLQGGLVAGATAVSTLSSTGAVSTTSATAKSTVITWSNVSDGDYSVTYTVHRATGTNPITGAWSFKYNGGQYGYTTPETFGF
jgi:hypothetical protein